MATSRRVVEQRVLRRLSRFSRLLRAAGVAVTVAEEIDATAALEHTDMLNQEEFYNTLRTTLIKHASDYPVFDRLFREFWLENRDPFEEPPAHEVARQESQPGASKDSALSLVDVRPSTRPQRGEQEKPVKVAVYSPTEVKARKVFGELDREGAATIRRAVRRLRRRLATMPGRRFAASKSGEADLKRMMRESLSHGGEVLHILSRKRRVTRIRLIVLCDISGSMEGYTERLLKTLHQIRSTIRSAEVFVFSTDLVRLTEHLVGRSLKSVAQRISKDVLIWGSGTRIGHCLYSFNRSYPGLVNKDTVVLVISDGWDVGDTEVLRRSLQEIRMKAGRLVWVNPLADNPEYEPLSEGMRTALPFIDVFAGLSIFTSRRQFERFLGRAVSPLKRPPVRVAAPV